MMRNGLNQLKEFMSAFSNFESKQRIIIADLLEIDLKFIK